MSWGGGNHHFCISILLIIILHSISSNCSCWSCNVNRRLNNRNHLLWCRLLLFVRITSASMFHRACHLPLLLLFLIVTTIIWYIWWGLFNRPYLLSLLPLEYIIAVIIIIIKIETVTVVDIVVVLSIITYYATFCFNISLVTIIDNTFNYSCDAAGLLPLFHV